MMNKLIITSFFLFFLTVAFSQDCFDKVIKLGVQIDSLKKVINQEKDTSAQRLKLSNDSITKIITKNKSEVANLNGIVGKLEKDTAILNKQIKKLGKDNYDKLEAQLKLKADSINLLTGKINVKDSMLYSERQLAIKKAEERYTEGQKIVFNKVRNDYEGKEFDELINISTKLSIERDLNILSSDTTTKQKLQNLQIYFAAKSVLDNKFDSLEVKKVERQLNDLNEKSDLLEKLKNSVHYYKLSNEALKKTFDEIKKIEKKLLANDDGTQKIKLGQILVEVAWFFRNYRFNFTDYPYLSDIVLETMKRKQKDANSDISDLVEKL